MKRARLDHAEEFVRGNEHRLSQFGHFMHICMHVFEVFQMYQSQFRIHSMIFERQTAVRFLMV